MDEDEAVINHHFFDRERTPTNLQDAKMLDTIVEDKKENEGSIFQTSVGSGSTLFSGPMDMQVGLLQERIGQSA